MEAIKLLLVDDHDVIRTSLKTFLESQGRFEVVAEASNGKDAIERALESNPMIVIMDISMPGMDGLEATRQLKKTCPGSQVLALTVHDDKHYFMEMLAAGASGYLTKQAAAEELVAALDAIAQGNVYLQPALARWLLEDYQSLANRRSPEPAAVEEPQPEPTSLDVLSARERQVLELVAQGRSNIEIGEQLGLSHKTIARHRERIMNKLHLHSRTELVKFAIRTKLITLE
ncbi:MAG TPA: response regulator transcription factor [Anaerolineales bacterium]|nr:response regulator transcription factor [Anaerolineales bacterium]